MSKIILAISGLTGAGKTEVTEYLIRKTGFPKVHFGETTFNEVRKKGLELTEINERQTREELRAKYGMGAYVILNLPKIKELFQNSSVYLESFYSWEEYLEMKKEFGDSFKVLAVHASPETRERRTAERLNRPYTKEEFISRDYSQIENLHQAGPIARADFAVINEGSKEDLHKQLDIVIEKLFTEKQIK